MRDTAQTANWVNCNAASHRTKVIVMWKRNGASSHTATKYGPTIRC